MDSVQGYGFLLRKKRDTAQLVNVDLDPAIKQISRVDLFKPEKGHLFLFRTKCPAGLHPRHDFAKVMSLRGL